MRPKEVAVFHKVQSSTYRGCLSHSRAYENLPRGSDEDSRRLKNSVCRQPAPIQRLPEQFKAILILSHGEFRPDLAIVYPCAQASFAAIAALFIWPDLPIWLHNAKTSVIIFWFVFLTALTASRTIPQWYQISARNSRQAVENVDWGTKFVRKPREDIVVDVAWTLKIDFTDRDH